MLTEVVPERLEGLAMWAALGGWQPHADRTGLLPLLVPLGRRGDEIVGILRWPTPESDTPNPVVRTHGHQLHLVAPSVEALLHRSLVELDARGAWDFAFAVAADPEGSLYTRGALAASRLPLPAYLLMKVGVDHDFFAKLIDRHFERGDETAALVTGDRVARESYGFARAVALRAHSLARAGKMTEAAEAARTALYQPVWTLGEPFAPFARLAGWKSPVTSIAYQRLATDTTKLPADRAAHLMDQVAVDEGDWDAIRPELAALYQEAGLAEVAELVG
jgi:hypothetical protein